MLNELEVFNAMQTAERFPEGVWLVIRHWVNNQYQKKLEGVCNKQLLGVFRDCGQIKRNTPRCRVVFDDLWLSAFAWLNISRVDQRTVFKREQIRLSTAWRLHCVVIYVNALMSICATMSGFC